MSYYLLIRNFLSYYWLHLLHLLHLHWDTLSYSLHLLNIPYFCLRAASSYFLDNNLLNMFIIFNNLVVVLMFRVVIFNQVWILFPRVVIFNHFWCLNERGLIALRLKSQLRTGKTWRRGFSFDHQDSSDYPRWHSRRLTECLSWENTQSWKHEKCWKDVQ